MDMSQLSEYDRNRVQYMIEQKQMKDFMRMYNSLIDRCFTDCCNDFTSSALNENESKCVNLCADKFMKISERVGQRFAEQNVALQEEMTKQ